MLADLLPLMTDTVRHHRAPCRDVFGRLKDSDETNHPARVTYTPGKAFGRATGESMPDAAATVWLIDHPFPIAIGDTFELLDGDALKVARLERRRLPDGVLHKVYLT